ncbi:Uncharacterised protein r2_g152 [Pycnogonum litorale]
MVRKYKRTSDRCKYNDADLKKALKLIESGIPVKTVARLCQIPARTLRRHRDNKVSTPGNITLGRYKTILSQEREEEFVSLVVTMQKSLFGLTTRDLRKWVFEFCKKHNIKNNFGKETEMAGPDWLLLGLAKITLWSHH